MAKVKVWNDNAFPLKEMFKGEQIEIPAGAWIAMESDDAILYRGQYKDPVLDGDGNHLAEGFKLLRLEPIKSGETLEQALTKSEKSKPDPLVCQACKFKAGSDRELAEHLKELHSDQVIVDEELDKQLKVEKKQRGRPKNVETAAKSA